MCGQVWWRRLGICALHLTHPSAHTDSSEHTHTHAHTHTDSSEHTRTHTHTRAHTDSSEHAHTHTLAHTDTHTHTHTHSHTHTHTHTHTHRQTHTHSHTHTHTHTYTHTHTHTVNTHPEQLWVRCLAQGSHLSRDSEGGRERERWLFTTKSKWLDNWDCLGFGGIKKGVNFYHFRMVVSTNC